MPDEENVGVAEQEQANVQQEIASPSDSDQQHNESTGQQLNQQTQRTDVEHNWREARRRMQELERRAQEYESELIRLKSQKSNPQQEEDILSKLSHDDIITKAQAERLAEQRAKKVVEEYIQQQEADTVEDRIQAKYPDFSAVVTDDAIQTLKQQHPEIAESLHALRNNPYKQAKAIYDAVKAFVPQKTQSVQQILDKKKATENAAKPMSVQAAPKQSVLGNAQIFENGLTPELKKQLYKEMQEAVKRY